ncbi:MAG: glycosyltransferase [Lachnospiraceae bacterium]|nr:glycosyltransferase [Lachnospiraceae bacterium]
MEEERNSRKGMGELELLQLENQKLKEENRILKSQLRGEREDLRLKDNHIYNLENIIAQQNQQLRLLHRIKNIPGVRPLIKGIKKLVQGIKNLPKRIMPKGSRRRRAVGTVLRTIRYPGRSYRLWSEIKQKKFSAGDGILDILYIKHGLLTFPEQEKPLVSIVIPVYNQIEYTFACLKSIKENTRDVPYEIILADDVSTDGTKEISLYVKGIRVVRNTENMGFLRNCNHAAEQAEGEYILFLNNDTQVTENWLSSLVELIESDDRIGMVGSKLVYPNWVLQEAGGIIWQDGSGCNYGRGDDCEKPQYNYVREADYISGASIMLSVKLWKKLGGFDERYVPAYCEDSDLAFEVRKAGYRVMYQPKSVVVHFEGISNGTDVNSSVGLKKYQVENTEKLEKKWHAEMLQLPQKKLRPANILCRDRIRGRKVILVIDHYVPEFDRDAGSRTTFQYLKMFVKKGYLVKFLGDNFYNREPYTSMLEQMGIEVLYGVEYRETIFDWILENRDNIDIVYANRPHITVKYIDFIKENTDIKIIYYGHDLHFLRERREYELTGDVKHKENSDYWKCTELEIMRKAEVSYYPSHVEEEAIHEIDPSIRVKAITAYTFDRFIENVNLNFAEREGFLFVGGFGHPPNADAVLWFVNEIYPLICKEERIPFYIVGSHVPEEIRALSGDGVVVKGFVSDEELAELYRNCRMAVVPLRYGAGVKGKVIEAIYYGIPVVTTAIGAEGILHAENILTVQDEAQGFAEQVLTLYHDTAKLERISRESQVFIRKYYSMDAVWDIVKEDFQ